MIIETKFDKGDTVFFLWSGEIRQYSIVAINIISSIQTKEETSIAYALNTYEFKAKVIEDKLYATKQEAATAWLKAQELEIALIIK